MKASQLSPASHGSREEVLDDLVEEMVEQMQRGENVELEAYLERYPELAEPLRKMWPTMHMLAALGYESAPDASAENGKASKDGDPVKTENQLGLLGDFQIVREVGRGGMGVVYEAEQISLKRRVALKVLPFAATMDPRHLQRFHNEARAAATLQHPHIVPVYAVGQERGVHYYAMQFVDGQTVAEVIRDRKQPDTERKPDTDEPEKLSGSNEVTEDYGGLVDRAIAAPDAETKDSAVARKSTQLSATGKAYFEQVARLGIQAAEALEHAHQLGIVHRDIKPGNLMLDGNGQIWVTDFGLARIESNVNLTTSGDLLGTLRYMSPEQALAKHGLVDHRTDVYSFGATLYEMLTLQAAVQGTDRREILEEIANEDPKKPRSLNRQIPVELETIVLKALAKEAKDRYATANALAEDLKHFLDDKPIKAKRPTLGQRTRKWAKRNPALVYSAAVGVMVALLVLGGSIGWIISDSNARRQMIEERVTRVLDDAETCLKEDDFPAAFALAQQAEGLLTQSEVSSSLDSRAQRLLKNVKLLLDLEGIMLQRSAIDAESQTFDYRGADRGYAKAFRDFGIDVLHLSVDEAARQFRAIGIADKLPPFLVDWSLSRKRVHNNEKDDSWKHLLAVARECDKHESRNRVRDALEKNDASIIAKLRQSDKLESIPVTTLAWLSNVAHGSEEAQRDLIAMLKHVQQETPDSFWINFQLAAHLQKQENPPWDVVIGYYRAALALRPEAVAVYNNLGNALLDKNDVEGAIEQYGKAIDIHPNVAGFYFNLGSALLDKNDVEGAIEQFCKAIDIDPNLAGGYNGLGIALVRMKDLDGAIEQFCRAIDIDHNYTMAYVNLGVALAHKNDLDGAIEQYRKAIDIDPNLAMAYANLGAALAHKNDVDGTIEQYRKAIDIDPNYAMAYANLGAALAHKNDLNGAIEQYRKAIGIDPNLAMAYNNLGNALRRKNDLDGAIEQYRKAVGIDPNYAKAYINLGSALRRNNDLDGAIEQYRKAIDIDPNLAAGYNNLGNALLDKNDVDGAIEQYRKAIQFNPHHPEAHYNLGHTLRDKGQFVQALKHLKRGHELGSQRPGWPYSSAQWVKMCETLVQLDEVAKEFSVNSPLDSGVWRGLLTGEDPLDSQQKKSHAKSYTCTFEAGQTYLVELNSGGFDTFLRIEDSTGKTLAFNDDIRPGLNTDSRLLFRPERTDKYRVIATTFSGGETGPFFLVLDQLKEIGKPTIFQGKLAENLPLWQGKPRHIEKVKLQAGKTYLIDLKSKEFDPLLFIGDGKGKILLLDEDGGDGHNARLLFSPEWDREYGMVIVGDQPGATGEYTLTIQECRRQLTEHLAEKKKQPATQKKQDISQADGQRGR